MTSTRSLLAAAAACLLLTDCAQNPVSGNPNFVTMSESQEVQVGRQEDVKVRQQYGVYDDKALQKYVNEIGQRLAQVAREQRAWTYIHYFDKSGRPGQPIRYWAYRDEQPVFDASEVNPPDRRINAFQIVGSSMSPALEHGDQAVVNPVLLPQAVVTPGYRMGVNYGCNRVRLMSPVPVGAKLRLGVKLLSVDDIAGGVQVTYELTFETEGSTKPSCVAECIYRSYE